jgi:hypothetical protein
MCMARLRSLAHSSTAPINVLLVMNRFFFCLSNYPILQLHAFLKCVHSSHCSFDYPSTKMCHCVHGRDAIYDVFASIAEEITFHINWEQLHGIPLSMFQISRCHVHIVLSRNRV